MPLKLRFFTALVLSVFFSTAFSQQYNYTWMKGSATASLPVYGTQGVAAIGNNPGPLYLGVTWYDASGNLWLYGGMGESSSGSGDLSDMWKYSIATNNWTWISGPATPSQAAVYGTLGIASAGNTPGARRSAGSWTDVQGNLWLFGGSNGSQCYNDLWKYTIATGLWTWMGGSTISGQTPVYGPITVPTASAMPRATYDMVTWKDASGNFWMYDAVFGREVWKYNPTTFQWAWMSGTSNGTAISSPASYGPLGSFGSTYYPGPRYTTGAADASGNLYVFGGRVYTATGFGRANDLWKYDITSNLWAWMGGTQSTSGGGSYGPLGVYTSTAVPPGRYGHVLWADNANGRLLLFGGEVSTLSGLSWFNDTWSYNTSNGQWAWIKGSNTVFTSASTTTGTVLGIQTQPGLANTPGQRVGATNWHDSPNSMWLLSGITWGSMTELWKLGACSSALTPSLSSSQNTYCPGSTATITAIGAGTTYSWSTGLQSLSIVVSPSNQSVYSFTTTAGNCAATASLSLPIHTLGISLVNQTTPLCTGNSFTLSGSSSGTYSWSSGQTTQSIVVSPSSPTVYSLNVNNNGCVLASQFSLAVQTSPVLSIAASAFTLCSGQSATLAASGANSYFWSSGQTTGTITVQPTQSTLYTLTGTSNGCIATVNYSMSVQALPNLSVNVSPTLICNGSSATISALGATSYTWPGSSNGISITLSPSQTTRYSLIGSNGNCSNTKTFLVAVQANPIISILSSSTQVCSGSSVTLTGQGASNLSWNTGQTTSTLQINPLVTTTYSLTGSINNCSSTAVFTQSVLALPSLSIIAGNNVLCSGESTSITASGAASYTWNNSTTTTNQVQVSPAVTSIYTVSGTDANGCTNSAVVTITVNVCATIYEAIRKNASAYIFPNPASGNFTLRNAADQILYIYNGVGQCVFSKSITLNEEQVNLELRKGLYYCRIGYAIATFKLIIE